MQAGVKPPLRVAASFFCTYWLFQPHGVDAIQPVPKAISCLAYTKAPDNVYVFQIIATNVLTP